MPLVYDLKSKWQPALTNGHGVSIMLDWKGLSCLCTAFAVFNNIHHLHQGILSFQGNNDIKYGIKTIWHYKHVFLNITVRYLCKDSFAWSPWRQFTSVPACDWSIWLSWFTSLWRKLRQRGRPAIESERKKFSTRYNFLNSWSVKSYETFRLWWLHCCALHLKVRAKIVTSLLKHWTLNICPVQIQWVFSDALPFYSAGSWVSALSGSAAGELRPSKWQISISAFSVVVINISKTSSMIFNYGRRSHSWLPYLPTRFLLISLISW